MDFQYCCDGFRHSVGEGGKRGLAIIPIVDAEGSRRFRFQSRGCDYDDIERLNRFILSLPHENREQAPRVNLVVETGLAFCPWCGSRLDGMIEQNQDAFQRLAASMKHLKQEAMTHESLGT